MANERESELEVESATLLARLEELRDQLDSLLEELTLEEEEEDEGDA